MAAQPPPPRREAPPSTTGGDPLKDQWAQLRPQLRSWWDRLTEADLVAIDGHKDRLIGTVQTKAEGWLDPKYVAMLDEANRTLDTKKRYDILAQAEKYLLDAQPIVPIDTAAINWVKKPYVKGMYPNASSLYPWKYVYIERDPSKWDYGIPSLAD